MDQINSGDARRVVRISIKKLAVVLIIGVLIIFAILSSSSYESGIYGDDLSSVLSLVSYWLVLLATIIITLGVVFLLWGIVSHFIARDDIGRTLARKKVVYGGIAIVVMVAVWGALYFSGSLLGVAPGGGMDLPGVPAVLNSGGAPEDRYPGYSNYSDTIARYSGKKQLDVTDTREFMKTNYLAEIKVRDVSKVVNDVKNIVKGSDGRVDNFQSSEKKGYISFVVPKRNFDSFRDQVEALTHRRLYSENISSENLLGTKQTIETQTTAVVSELESLNRQKDALDKKHTQTVSAINAELARIKTELTLARKNISLLIGTTTDAALLSYWRDQEGSLTSQDSVQRQKLSSENSSYSYEKKDLDNQIAYQNSSLSYLSSQDTAFMNNVETVSGSVNVQWISWWQLARVFSPIHPTWIILILAVAVVAFLYHKKYIPKIELV